MVNQELEESECSELVDSSSGPYDASFFINWCVIGPGDEAALTDSFYVSMAKHKSAHRRNIDDERSEDYFKTCEYSSNDRYCPIFSLRQIVEMAGENFTALSIKVSPIPILWI